jgi:16S rRNA A1518/A1519 N6-dimethyltransferase RsmA/KsgA/DIM1 with predicted DNA glycosylase/AP lyase activity
LSLFIDKKCNTKEVLFVAKENFIPAPKIESSVLFFEKHNLYNEINDEKFFKIIKA